MAFNSSSAIWIPQKISHGWTECSSPIATPLASGYQTRLSLQTDNRFQINIILHVANRVLKWWRHKNEISEIMGFVRIFWENNVQEAYLPKMSIWGQIVSEMLAGYTQKTPYKPF